MKDIIVTETTAFKKSYKKLHSKQKILVDAAIK